MPRFLVACLLCLACLLGTARPAAAADGFVHRSGTTLVDGAGNRVLLRGAGFGGWLMWEHWIMGSTALNSTAGSTTMLNRLGTLVGAPRVATFKDDVIGAYTTQADVQQVAALGFNVVRVPINHDVLDGASTAGWRALDDVVDWAQQAGIYVVFDLHAAPGGQSSFFIADPDAAGQRLWDKPALQAQTIDLWKTIAARYAGRTTVAGYDLLNEPFAPSKAALVDLYTRITTAIRSVDPNHLLIYEGGQYARETQSFQTRPDANSALSIHQYLWGTLTPEADLQSAAASGRRLDMPVWIGEMGLDSYANIADRVRRYDSDPAFSGWAAWPWKAALQASGRMSLNQFIPTPAWQKTVNWMADPTRPKPTAAEAEQGMTEYVALVRSATPDVYAQKAYGVSPSTTPSPSPTPTASPTATPTATATMTPTDPTPTPTATSTPTTTPTPTPTPDGPRVPDPTPVPAEGTGLTATYYGDAAFAQPVLTRVDPAVDFDWGLKAPVKGAPIDNFAVRWTGQLQAPATGPVTLTTTADDLVRVWVGGKLVIDDWVANGKHTKSGTLDLVAGQRYPLRIDYVDQAWGASVRLQWTPPGGSQAVVPMQWLYP